LFPHIPQYFEPGENLTPQWRQIPLKSDIGLTSAFAV
jgi:hypothetical protein